MSVLCSMPQRAATLALAAACVPAWAGVTEWQFDALLDGKPIGSHTFELVTDAHGRTVQLRSLARFEVKLLGISLYRYRHLATETWSGDCLAAIESSTDDDGRVTELQGSAAGSQFMLQVRLDGDAPTSRSAPTSCLMSFAYWHPGLAGQRQLLDPGTGRFESVSISVLPEATLDVAGRSTKVRGLRIGGLTHPIDVWSAAGRWVGLDTTVTGGRRLSYRLR